MLRNIEQLAQKYNSVEDVKKELKRVQSLKCRLKKQKAREDYEVEMSKIVSLEQALKEVKEYFEPKKVTVTTMTAADIALLNHDETIKAIKSIQSKKCLSQYNSPDPATNVEYQEALKIEQMLKDHKETVKPIEDTVVKKSDINNLIHHLENSQEDISKEYILEMLKDLIK